VIDGGNVQFTVAIDGPAAAGKGTIARAVAAAFGFGHLDTGMLYRAVGKKALDMGRGVLDEGAAILCAQELSERDLAVDGLRTALASRASSKVAAIPEVRQALLDYQRRFAKREGGAVLDGRDIGTVVCPDAPVKIFVTASDQERARRRFEELTQSGADTTLDAVSRDLAIRDGRDASRDAAPMRAAKDAVLLDTTELDIDAAVAQATALIKERIEQARGI
jgi:cytidylate kinase